MKYFVQEHNQVILHTPQTVCASKWELLRSNVFQRVLQLYIEHLQQRESPLLTLIPLPLTTQAGQKKLREILEYLCEMELGKLPDHFAYARKLLTQEARTALHELVEGLYDYWRTFDRFLVLHSEPGPSSFDRRPYRAFNNTAEALTHLIRLVYRDICENITGDHPRVYRQVSAGCDVGLIAIPKKVKLPKMYEKVVGEIPFIRQVWIAPPMIIDPPMNTRTGEFQRVESNPLKNAVLNPQEWLCYPAQIGSLIIYIYFHQRFFGLGCALSNLFEMATDEQLAQGPAAIYLYGMPSEYLSQYGSLPTVFFDDAPNRMLVAAVPGEERFGYFGYLKKMALTLHNIVMLKRGQMPYHGAMMRLALKNGRTSNVLIIGDTATGKSETLEAMRTLGGGVIRDLRIVADDMGSLKADARGNVLGYGTETGAFIRLDDLQAGYAFGQIDRAIIMSPQKVNARVVIPVTTIAEVLQGYPVDYLLYANNYEDVDNDHPILDRIGRIERALEIFSQGAAMAKGTTTSHGLQHSYFANIFGPPQYREVHEKLAEATFRKLFAKKVWVGQMRTRLGIPGYASQGPQAAAQALLALLTRPKKKSSAQGSTR